MRGPLALVLYHYPVSSIRDIKFKLFAFGPWSEQLLEVEGRKLSLNDIEHGIIRPIWPDPRIHYLLNCAAVGCPNLRPRRLRRREASRRRWEEAARDYVNDRRGVRFDDRGRMTLSKIYLWYEEDFGGSVDGVLAHLRRYADPALATRLQGRERVDDYAYDWSLNDAAGAPAQHDAQSDEAGQLIRRKAGSRSDRKRALDRTKAVRSGVVRRRLNESQLGRVSSSVGVLVPVVHGRAPRALRRAFPYG